MAITNNSIKIIQLTNSFLFHWFLECIMLKTKISFQNIVEKPNIIQEGSRFATGPHLSGCKYMEHLFYLDILCFDQRQRPAVCEMVWIKELN